MRNPRKAFVLEFDAQSLVIINNVCFSPVSHQLWVILILVSCSHFHSGLADASRTINACWTVSQWLQTVVMENIHNCTYYIQAIFNDEILPNPWCMKLESEKPKTAKKLQQPRLFCFSLNHCLMDILIRMPFCH